VRRGLSPAKAQAIHEQGLPGFGFRSELRRVYPGGAGLGAIVGYVDIDNRGRAGIERFIDQQGAADAVFAPERSGREPVRLAIDLSVQAALADELQQALSRYAAKAAAGVVLDVRTGEVLASSSLPAYAAGDAAAALDPALTDRMLGGTYELGSVFKVATLALASEAGIIEPGRTFDATQPITVGRFRIDDYKPKRRSLSAEEVFLYSSNLGAARMAEEAGDTLQRRLLTRLGLLEPMATEVGTLPAPQLPKNWGRIHTMTVAYGHGIALAPLQFAAGMAALVNGGQSVKPHFLRQDKAPQAASPVIGPTTDQLVRRLMRLNVAHPEGTGGRAAVAGYDVGGKTGTADVPIAGGYSKDAAVTSFVAAFPMRAPRYLTYVVLFEPRPEAGVDRAATAGLNAAPTTARIIRRIAPMLGLAPQYDNDGS
jgi:cell division protein FtsI (penicillin-binding protein 3)